MVHTMSDSSSEPFSESDEESVQLYGKETAAASSQEEDKKPDVSDEGTFSWLMSRIETQQREIKELRKQLNPIRKRLRAKMEAEDLESLECGAYVMLMEPEDTATSVVYSKEKLTEFFSEEQVEAYEQDPVSKRAPRKRRKVKCERLVINVDDENE